MRHIYVSDVNGKPAVCFDTGLDARSFARTKMSQSLTESGFIVRPDGSREVWKLSGVNEVDGQMRIWGSHFTGKRLDLLLNEIDSAASQQTAFAAVIFWLRAKMLLGDTYTALDPGAVFVCLEDDSTGDHAYPKGSVFFAPENLANRCLFVERTKYSNEPSGGAVPAKKQPFSSVAVPILDRYNCPDLTGMEAVAFCAGTFLYKILANAHPYPDDTIFQDMREGVFMPVHFAISCLDKKFCGLIQSALLLPVAKKRSNMSGTDIISEMLRMLIEDESQTVPVSSLFVQLSPEENMRLEKEKKRHLKIQNVLIKTKRFVLLNKQALIWASVAIFFILFLVVSTTRSFYQRPTTKGMVSDAVTLAYYEAFDSLDHRFMEACVQGRAGKNDINAVMNIIAVDKTRQAYEMSTRSTYITAKEWIESGGEQPSTDVFGITDLSIFHLSGREEDGLVMYRVNYLLWSPDGYIIDRSDILTLTQDRRKNWKITEIVRVEEYRYSLVFQLKKSV